MASLRQVAEILDDVLNLPPSSSRWHAQRLQAAGLIPSTPGRPAHLASEHVAVLLLSVAVGASQAADYSSLQPGGGGPTLGNVLAGIVDAPNDVLEVIIDAAGRTAAVTIRGLDRGVQRIAFASHLPAARPGFDREVRFGPEVFVRIHAAIKAAPEVRAGRKAARTKYSGSTS